jgi:hypothetical protein
MDDFWLVIPLPAEGNSLPRGGETDLDENHQDRSRLVFADLVSQAGMNLLAYAAPITIKRGR